MLPELLEERMVTPKTKLPVHPRLAVLAGKHNKPRTRRQKANKRQAIGTNQQHFRVSPSPSLLRNKVVVRATRHWFVLVHQRRSPSQFCCRCRTDGDVVALWLWIQVHNILNSIPLFIIIMTIIIALSQLGILEIETKFHLKVLVETKKCHTSLESFFF